MRRGNEASQEAAEKARVALRARKQADRPGYPFSKILFSGLKIVLIAGFFLILYQILRNSLLKSTLNLPTDENKHSPKKYLSQAKTAEAIHYVQQQQQLADVKELVNQANIYCKPEFIKELRSSGQIGLANIKLIERQIAQIKRLLPNLFHSAALMRILSNKDFKIILLAANDPQLTMNGKAYPDARYLPKSNTILLCVDSDFTDQEVIQTLRNELHHALVKNANDQLNPSAPIGAYPTDGYLGISPFLKSQWQTDSKKVTSLAKAIEEGFENINELEKLLNTSKKDLSPENKDKLNHYLVVFHNYHPQVFRQQLPLNQAETMLTQCKKLPNGKYLLETPDTDSTKYLVFDSPIVRGNTAVLKYTTAKSGSPRDLASSFINDMRHEYSNILHGNYNHLSDENKLLEFSSNLQERDGRVLKRFFHPGAGILKDILRSKIIAPITSKAFTFSINLAYNSPILGGAMQEFLSISLLIILAAISPGPDFALVTKNSLMHSRKAGIFTALGVSVSLLVHAFYCILGLAVIISQSLLVFSIIKYLGAAYLIYIGIKSLLAKRSQTNYQYEHAKNSISGKQAFFEGLFCNLLNPKAIMFLLAFFTLVVNPNESLLVELSYGAEIAIIHMIWFSSLAYMLTHRHVKSQLNRVQYYIVKAMGALLIVFGIGIAAQKQAALIPAAVLE